MKRRRLARLLNIGLITLLMAGLFTACSDEKVVDYSIEGISEEQQPQSEGGKIGLAQFEDGEIWKETFFSEVEAIASDGETYSMTVYVNVDAQIEVPQAKQMSVIEVIEPEMDEEYKQTIAENIFASGEIYYVDKAVDNPENEENAEDTYVPVEEYTKNKYIGSYNGQLYSLSFAKPPGDYCYQKQIIFTPINLNEICPEKYKDQKNLVCSPWTWGDWVENACSISEEDALKEAKLFAENLGLEYPVVSTIRPLAWGNVPEVIPINGLEETDDWGINGYVFSFDFGVDDISFVNYGVQGDYEHNWTFGSEWKWLNDDTEHEYSLNTRLEIYVTDRGVVRMVANNPLEITGVSEGVELLPLDTIKGIIKEELAKDWKSFHLSYDTKYFNGMELIYFRVRDKENPGKYSYVPTWRLATVMKDAVVQRIDISRPILINAIDGSVIDFFDET